MKKNVLALSIAAMVGGLGFAGMASAGVVPGTGAAAADLLKIGTSNAQSFRLAEGGTGHNLIVPYFNAQNGNMTVLHLVNTDTVKGKAVKVRFRGAANSDDLLDFQVYLSPQDVWTAAVTQGADGRLQLQSSDNTCTVPALRSRAVVAGEDFDSVPVKEAGKLGFFNSSTGRLNPKLSAEQKANGTREGYVEIFNMADITEQAWYGAGGNQRSALYQTIKHNTSGVAACDTAVLEAVAVETNFKNEDDIAAAGLNAPTGQLMADWYIQNIAQSTTYSGAATTLTAVTGAAGAGIAATGNFVLFPQSPAPAVTDETVNNVTADPLFRSAGTSADIIGTTKTAAGAVSGLTATTAPVIRAGYYDLPDMSTPYLTPLVGSAADAEAQAQALTRALAVDAVINQYANDTSVSGKTDWVFSMPTRRYSVALDYKGADTTNPAVAVFSRNINGAAAGADSFFHSGNSVVTAARADARICVNAVGQAFFGREEESRRNGAVLSPGEVEQARFCGETSVLSFRDANASVLGASVARQDTGVSAFTRGWASISVYNNTASPVSTAAGLPILGHAFLKLTNPAVSAGQAGTYGITWPHRYNRR